MVKMNYEYTCKHFYTFKEKHILEAAKSNKKYDLNSNNEPKLLKWKIWFLIIREEQQHISLLYIYIPVLIVCILLIKQKYSNTCTFFVVFLKNS
jgi:hypothetical protein